MVDPGCSLITNALVENHQEGFDPIEVFYEKLPNCNIRYALRPVLDPQAGQVYNLPAADVFKVADRNQLLPNGIVIPQHLQIPIPETLYLLAGHPLFGLWETTFTLGCENPAGSPGLFFFL